MAVIFQVADICVLEADRKPSSQLLPLRLVCEKPFKVLTDLTNLWWRNDRTLEVVSRMRINAVCTAEHREVDLPGCENQFVCYNDNEVA